ncbi:hypothetical protein DPMN_190483 [Dreissena polymorpha]|uniref:Uncharacterized protein n=1 Tax=Dreissena polymorpha TaxID=45954 RepID=A0A9D4IC03_DREPO|nr:hypothetical protein DPMN_190483 [Dreissena polymorpha]
MSEEDENTEKLQSANAEIISNPREVSLAVSDNDDYAKEVQSSTAQISNYWREHCVEVSGKRSTPENIKMFPKISTLDVVW